MVDLVGKGGGCAIANKNNIQNHEADQLFALCEIFAPDNSAPFQQRLICSANSVWAFLRSKRHIATFFVYMP